MDSVDKWLETRTLIRVIRGHYNDSRRGYLRRLHPEAQRILNMINESLEAAYTSGHMDFDDLYAALEAHMRDHIRPEQALEAKRLALMREGER